MLNRKTPETLSATLTFKGQGATSTEQVVFYNRSESDIRTESDKLNADPKAEAEPRWVAVMQFLYLVKSVNGQTPTEHDVMKMEEDFPGTIVEFFYAYHEQRRVAVVKN